MLMTLSHLILRDLTAWRCIYLFMMLWNLHLLLLLNILLITSLLPASAVSLPWILQIAASCSCVLLVLLSVPTLVSLSLLCLSLLRELLLPSIAFTLVVNLVLLLLGYNGGSLLGSNALIIIVKLIAFLIFIFLLVSI